MKRRDVLGFGLAITATLALGLPPLAARAQGKYPERPIRLVIPFSPGGNTDVVGRLFAAKMTLTLGQQVFVENKAGASGAIGSLDVARARPDGYTLLVGVASTHVINPLTEKLPYDPVKDFTPINMFSVTPQALGVHPTIATSLPELIKRVKAKPGEYAYGSCGLASICHLAGALFIRQTGGLEMIHVPYKGSGQSVQELIGGQIPMVFGTTTSMVTHHRSGRLRMLAVFNEKRSAAEPSVPTAIELGVPDAVAYTFTLLLAPAGTPKPVIEHLQQATSKTMSDVPFQKNLERLTVDPVTDSNPETAARFIKSELVKWAPIIKASGIKVQ
ncbi:MAG: tripartite tricarboxylate transporter substrate binding protein [Betaproteobacteria bacterium]|nr:tripartite tricarboxylate transporter substrate binding protein [Betaproteobacteria bacterium]MBI2224609.1 tripartite tricarboxylate transporter substrate binding protein [Betaproteobacteria bacterium]